MELENPNDPANSRIVLRIDASALKNASCILAFYNTVVEGYRSELNNNDVEFGTAVHLFLKAMCETGGNLGVAIHTARKYYEETKMVVKSTKKYLDSLHLCKVCTDYWFWLQNQGSNFQILLGANKKPAVEITFSHLWYEDKFVVVYLEGTIDKVGQFVKGICAIGDYKTTSSRDAEEYFRGYEESTQLKFYYLNLHLYAKRNPDSMIAEICSKGQVGAFIDGIFLNGKDKTEFARSRIFTFKPEKMKLYEHMLNEKIRHLIDCVNGRIKALPEGMLTDTCSKPENSTNGAWRCRFFNACSQPDEIASGHVYRQHFIKREYRPLEFGKDKSNARQETKVS